MATRSLCASVCSLVTLSALLAGPSGAATVDWLGNTDVNLSTPGNWSTPPNSGDLLSFGVAGTAGTALNYNLGGGFNADFVFTPTAAAYSFSGGPVSLIDTIANNSSNGQIFATEIIREGNGNLSANAGELIFNGSIKWAKSGNMVVSGTQGVTLAGADSGGGKLTVVSGNNLPASFGLLNLTGAVRVGVNIDGSPANEAFQGVLTLGTSGGGNGVINVETGGALSILGTTDIIKDQSIIGQQAQGILNINGGSVTIGTEAGLILGNSVSGPLGPGKGTVNLNSGNLTILSGTTTTTTGGVDTTVVMMGRDEGQATGTINLNGGVLSTDRQFVRDGSTDFNAGSAIFNFNGGTLRALSDQTDWLRSNNSVVGSFLALTTTAVQAGGAIVDSNGFSVAINTALVHDTNVPTDGGLVKTGAGTLRLGGANTYNGSTLVNAGTLLIDGNQSGATGNVSVASGATLGGVGTVGGATVIQGNLAPGTDGTAGTLSFTSSLDLANSLDAGWLKFELGTSSDLVSLTTGTLAIGSGILNFDDFDFTALAGFGVGTYTLFATTQVISGSFGAQLSGTISGQSATLSLGDGGSDVILNVVPEPATGTLLLAGLAGWVLVRRRRNG